MNLEIFSQGIFNIISGYVEVSLYDLADKSLKFIDLKPEIINLEIYYDKFIPIIIDYIYSTYNQYYDTLSSIINEDVTDIIYYMYRGDMSQSYFIVNKIIAILFNKSRIDTGDLDLIIDEYIVRYIKSNYNKLNYNKRIIEKPDIEHISPLLFEI